MYKHILDPISGSIDWMALLPLLLFTVVFTGVVLVTLRERKGHMDYMANLPLQDPDHQPKSNPES